MKRYIIGLLLLVLSSTSSAQWQRVGWQGGTIGITVQLGNTLFGVCGNGYYRSSDVGRTWSPFNEGLPISSLSFNYGQLLGANVGDYLGLINDYVRVFDSSYHGLYYCKEGDDHWSFKRLGTVIGVTEQPKVRLHSIISEDTLLVIVGDYNGRIDSTNGLFCSTDGGSTWSRRMDGFDTHYPQMSFARVGLSLFATNIYHDASRNVNFMKSFRSEDLGLHWESVKMPATDSLWSWVFSFGDGVLGLLNQGSLNGSRDTNTMSLFLSYDTAKTWVRFSGAHPPRTYPFNMWSFGRAGDRDYVSLEWRSDSTDATLVYTSADRGTTWLQADTSGVFLMRPQIFGYDNNFLIAGNTAYWRSDSTFTGYRREFMNQGVSNQGNLVYVTGHRLVATSVADSLGMAHPETFDYSTDDGSTWTRTLFHDHDSISDLLWVKNGNDLCAIGNRAGSHRTALFVSSTDGRSWSLQSELPVSWKPDTLLVMGDTIFLAVDSNYYHRKLFRSLDRGMQWQSITLPYYFDQEKFGLTFGDGELKVLMNSGGYGSTDLGNTWSDTIRSAPIEMTGVRFGNAWFRAIGSTFPNRFRMQHSFDNGTTWSDSKGLSSRFSILPSIQQGGILYAVGVSQATNDTSGEGHNAVYYSLDTGRTWVQLGGYFTDASHLSFGSDYLFVAGLKELWRFPRPTFAVPQSHQRMCSDVAIDNVYPNPARDQMQIGFSIPSPSPVTLRLFDITGKERALLIKDSREEGAYGVLCNSSMLESGTYLARLEACGTVVTRSVTVVR